MTHIEAMRLALEALESVTGHFTRTPSTLRDSEVRGEAHKAITALRQAIAEAEKAQPVAWISKNNVVYPLDAKDEVHPINDLQPLYTTPPKRKPLTDLQQIAKALRQHELTLIKTTSGYDVVTLNELDAHGIKEKT